MEKFSYKNVWMMFATIVLLFGCKKDDIDKEHSIFDVTTEEKSVFDDWLHENYIQSYNIDFKYRMDDKDIDYNYNLAPASLSNSMQLAVIIKHAWLEAYTEVAGIDFIRKHAPAILPIIGCAAWNGDGTFTLGTAEGGLKITLYMGNWLDPTDIAKMNQYFFKTMHHEFTHILQQDVYYPNTDYDKISASDYRPSGWQNRHFPEYAKLGFITAYAGSCAVEDITEVTACYITMTEDELRTVFDAAGEEGRQKLLEKIKIMKSYMKDVWHIDMDQLRKVVHRRMEEVVKMPLILPEWMPLIKNESKSQVTMEQLISDMRKQLPAANVFLEKTPGFCHVHDASMIEIINEH